MAGPEEFTGVLVPLETHDGCMVQRVMEISRSQCLVLAGKLELQENGAELTALNARIEDINQVPCGYRGSLCPRILAVQSLLVNAVSGIGPSGKELQL